MTRDEVIEHAVERLGELERRIWCRKDFWKRSYDRVARENDWHWDEQKADFYKSLLRELNICSRQLSAGVETKIKKLILDTVDDLVTDFIWYDRRNDEDLEPGEIEKCIENGTITADEIKQQFAKKLDWMLENRDKV